MAVLKIRDNNGTVTEIVTIKGDTGPKGDKGDPGDSSAPHASRHAAGGSDPITPQSIGAALEEHTHPQADWNQNDSTASDYVKNRPFYSDGFDITWDGDTTGKVSVMGCYKVSDITPSIDDLIGATVYDNAGYEFTITQNSVSDYNGAILSKFISVCSQPGTYDGVTFTETGTYFAYTNESRYISGLSTVTVVQIPEEYIPRQFESIEGTTVIVEGSYAFETGGMEGSCVELTATKIATGQEYLVVFDGVEYTLTAFNDYNIPTLGSSYDDNFSEYPFNIYYHNDALKVCVESAGTHEIAVSYSCNKIAEKHLPDTLASITYVQDYVSENAGSGAPTIMKATLSPSDWESYSSSDDTTAKYRCLAGVSDGTVYVSNFNSLANDIICSPDPDSLEEWVRNGVKLSGIYGSDKLSFTASKLPTSNIAVKLMVFNYTYGEA